MTWRASGAIVVLALCSLPAWALTRSGADARVNRSSTPAVPSVLRLALPDASPTIDPALVADEGNVELAGLLYTGLVRLDSHYQVVPSAAAWYDIGRDHQTYTFHLRRGLRFSNGDPLTAYDFRYSIERSLSPKLKSPSAGTYLIDIQGAQAVLDGKASHVAGIAVLDRWTIRIRARWPVPYFLTELAYPTSFAVDAKQIGRYGGEDNTGWYSNPASSGPYRLFSWSSGSGITLVRNRYFTGVTPSIKWVTVGLGSLPSSGVYQFVNRTFDVAALPLTTHHLLRQAGIRATTSLAIGGIYMNVSSRPFSDPHVRRALTMALRRSLMVRQALGWSAVPFWGYVPSGEWGYEPHLSFFFYDGARARAALRAGGYPYGRGFPPVTLYYAQDPGQAKLAQEAAQAWRSVLHISVDTQALTVNTLFARVQSDSLSLYLSEWTADYPDPHDWLALQWRSDGPDNAVHYRNARFDQLVKRADVTWTPRQRAALLSEAQQALIDDAAWIPLYLPVRLEFVRSSVDNLFVTGYGMIPLDGNWAMVRFHRQPARSGQAR